MKPEEATQHHLTKKQLMHAGLATITVVGGMGATPLTLADEVLNDRTEEVQKDTSSTDTSSTIIDPLPNSELLPETAGVPTAETPNLDEETNFDTTNGNDTIESTSNKTVTNDNFAPSTTTKAEERKAKSFYNPEITGKTPYVFDRSYFTFSDDGKTLTGFSDKGSFTRQPTTEWDWDGNLVFGDDLSDVTTIGMGALSDRFGIKSINFENLTALTTIGADAFAEDLGLESINFGNLPNLTTIDYFAFASCHHLTTITVGALNPDLEIGENAFEGVDAGISDDYTLIDMGYLRTGGEIIPTDTTALNSAMKIRDTINYWAQNNYLDDVGYRYPADYTGTYTAENDWYINTKVNFTYLDENDQPITSGTDGSPVVGLADADVRVSDEYPVPTAPEIVGYTNGTADGGSVQTITSLNQTITYHYARAMAQPVTIFWVDTDGNQLDSETLTDVPSNELDLTPKVLVGYTFKAVHGTKVTAASSRAVTDFDWDDADETPVLPKLTYGENAGRNYKFVYAKVATDVNKPVTDSPSSTPKPSGSGEPHTGTTDKTPSTSSSATPDSPKTPSELPSSGGLPGSGGGTNTNNTTPSTGKTTTTGNKTILLNTPINRNIPAYITPSQTLPKSGKRTNYLIPALGTAILAGVVGLYVFGKKRKS
ncbi:leucine-rich repeat protein [Periweissella cryptocerci]|nr:leucine-rich repeat protein [Periweissella cryptocerci]